MVLQQIHKWMPSFKISMKNHYRFNHNLMINYSIDTAGQDLYYIYQEKETYSDLKVWKSILICSKDLREPWACSLYNQSAYPRLCSWAVGNAWKNKVVNTSGQNELLAQCCQTHSLWKTE